MSDQEQPKITNAIPLRYYDVATEVTPIAKTTQDIMSFPNTCEIRPRTTSGGTEVTPISKTPQDIMSFPDTCEIRPRTASGGHTFIVTTVRSETTTKTEQTDTKRGVEVTTQTSLDDDDTPSCSHASSTKAIVPIYSSLPSKLLRLHARHSAQAILESQSQSLDSQFGSDEESGATSGTNDFDYNDCADVFDCLTPTAPAMSPPPPSTTPVDCYEDKLIDVGMGSSIDDSEESEVDDELKPLAVDNHAVLHDVDLNSPPITEQQQSLSPHEANELSEANLERFRKHHHHALDNIYLHPNFKYDIQAKDEVDTSSSPPPPPLTADSPTEQKRVHRSFLTMSKKPSHLELDIEKANSVISNPASFATTDPCGDQSLVNEIDTLDPALVPSDELAAEITEAVEYYFSNESILKDAFLLKHVRRNKEGFVSLKLVSSFKRVRQLTKEWKVVGNAVRRKSRKIELNDIGTKVRRVESLPNFDETMPSRTIVACDLPLDKLTIEKVSDIFSKCGEIALIRILKPGMTIPVDVRQFMNKYPEMQQKECALVEYLESSAARDAKNLQGPFQVFDMIAPKKKTGKKAVLQVSAPIARMVENYRYYNDATYERTRGGSFSGVVPSEGDFRFKLRRNNSDFHTKVTPTSSLDYPHTHSNSYNNHYHQHSPPQHSYANHHQQQQHQHSPTHRGSFSGSSGEHHPHQHQYHHYQSRGSISHDSPSVTQPGAAYSPGNNMNFFAVPPRRYSNASTVPAHTATLGDSQSTAAIASDAVNNNSAHNNTNNTHNNIINSNNSSNLARRLSNCSDSYNSSNYSEMSRRPSNCSENPPQRRDSNCSENCPCSRRVSEFGQNEVYRKTSQGSIGSGVGERRFSNGSMQFERTFSNASDISRRLSNDFNLDRKQSLETQTGLPYENDGNVGGGGGGYNVFPRRYSNSFNASNKLAQFDNAQYINGRRISTDSGYDRRFSFGSEYEGSPRSRTGSFLSSYKHNAEFDGSPRSRTGSFLDGAPRSRSGSFAQRAAESLVRTPIGPDGSKGFGTRARKFGQTVSPV